MKRFALVSVLLYLFAHSLEAQTPRFIFDNDSLSQQISNQTPKARVIPTDSLARASMADSLSKIPPAIPAWHIDERFGERIPIAPDTSFIDFHRQSLVDGQDVAMTYLGNWGSPAQSRIFFDRGETSQFYFLDAFLPYYKRPSNQVFIDTKRPFSNIYYQSGGSRLSKEERFTGEMAMSFGKQLSVGFNVDYVYSRGYYAALANKQNSYDFWASYRSDKYQMHAFFGNNNFTNAENGGITNDAYLTGTVPDNPINTDQTQSFPTNIYDTWNKLRGRRLFVTNKYNLGYYTDEDDETFVPVASVILTNNYTDQQRRFHSNVADLLNTYYDYTADQSDLGVNKLNDRMSYWSFKNTLAISLNEGFRPWVKFSLKAFIEQDNRRYLRPGQKNSWVTSDKFSENSTVIGGVLSKEKGKFLRYNLLASVGVLGYNIGESRLAADISSHINIKGKEAIVGANAYIKNLKPTFFENNFYSKYHSFINNFDDIRRVYIGGSIQMPHTKTKLSGGVENLTNYIYYKGETREVIVNRQPINQISLASLQEGKNIQVVSLRLEQNMSYRILHWENQAVFQTSSNEDVLPLPKFSIYSNLYIQVKLAKVLGIQLGVDARYFTEYYGPGYDPSILQFYNQKETKIGNYPMMNAYANLNLKKAKFFVMMYNIGKDFNNSRYFSAAHYPLNPMIFKMGLSWNFTD